MLSDLSKTHEDLEKCQKQNEKVRRDLIDIGALKEKGEVAARSALEQLSAQCKGIDERRQNAENGLRVAERRIEDERRRANGLEIELKESVDRELQLEENEKKLKQENSDYNKIITASKDLMSV